MPIERVPAEFSERILEMIETGQLELPVMPDLVLRLQREISEGRSSATTIAGWIRADPAVAAALLRTANSSLYGARRPISDLTPAVARLGLRTVHSLVISIALKGQFQTKNPTCVRVLRRLWDHAMADAAASRALAGRQDHDAEEAFVAGLLHGIGRLVVLRAIDCLAQIDADVPTEIDAMAQLIEQIQAPLGVQVLTRWKLAPEIIETARRVELAPAEDDLPLVRIVRAADCFARKLGFHPRPDRALDLNAEPAIIGLGLSEIEVASLAVDLEDVIQALQSML